ncbi:ABC transporter permease [Tianweitania populi]|uniref:Membrane protein n=1 Tax=Tianweitania populi TaxID=1607949 RepID=A0A8J3DUT7_9HYPH|nr:FtsX-like permease family protein [Tianweitania populi]GHD22700.1 membrane protein [Tianweitania populi]
MIRFIAADLRRHWIGVLIVMLLIALATALGVAVTLQERALRLGSARAASAFDLVIGAAGSETQLILSSVFLQPAPLPLVPGQVLAELNADPRVAWAAPVGFGDFVAGYPIIGTTQAVLDGLSGVADGESFSHLGDAVIGSSVRRKIGDRFHPFHGTVGEAGHVHDDVDYEVVGRMKPTGTPWDRAILVPIEAVWAVHEHHDHEETAPAAAAGETPEEQHHNHAGHDHDHHGPFAALVDRHAASTSNNPGVPAIVVKPKSIADAYNLRQQYRRETTVAVFPGEVLTRLYGTLGDARQILSAVSLGAQALVAASILLVIAVHVLQRRRQIGALRAFGAPRGVVFTIVWLEAFAMLAAGVLAGFAIGYAAVRALSARLAEASGVAMPVEFRSTDLGTLGLLFVAVAIVTLIPALLAYRQSPAQALRS